MLDIIFTLNHQAQQGEGLLLALVLCIIFHHGSSPTILGQNQRISVFFQCFDFLAGP